jgi:hypothetical protein
MDSVRGWRNAASGSSRAAWACLVAAAVCGVAGVVINDAAGNPSKLSKHAVLIYGGSALVLWGLAVVLLLFGIARFNRTRHASEQEREQATARRLSNEHLTRARRLAGQLLAGEAPTVGQMWDVVLQPGERALLDGSLIYSRYYGAGSPATYTHASTRHYGNVGVGRVVLDHALDGAGNRRRAEEASFAVAARWRDRHQSKVVVTDRRVLCQAQAKGWLSFDHRAITAIQPVPETRSVVLEYPDTAPVCLSGPLIAEIMVIVVWALYGGDGLREHPALAAVRSVAPFPDLTGSERPEPSSTQTPARSPIGVDAAQRSTDGAPTGTAPVDLLAFVATRELVLPEQAARLLAVSESDAADQLQELVEQGLSVPCSLQRPLPRHVPNHAAGSRAGRCRVVAAASAGSRRVPRCRRGPGLGAGDPGALSDRWRPRGRGAATRCRRRGLPARFNATARSSARPSRSAV